MILGEEPRTARGHAFVAADMSAWFRGLGQLMELPRLSERTLRMEALIARLRLLVVTSNTLALAFLFDGEGMHIGAAWSLTVLTFVYAIPIVVFEPYRRWAIFQTSLASTAADSIAAAAFIAVTGAAASPFYPLYYLIIVAVAMRFELRQALMAALLYVTTYTVVYLWTPDTTTHAMGLLSLRVSYMMIIALGVGFLAREEKERTMQVQEFERLTAENMKLQALVERDAQVDRLTGLLNRGYFERRAQKEVVRAGNASSPYSMLFCDLDGLKRVNDELGHDAGDRVLRAVGTELKRVLPGHDMIGRYGGDEFVVLVHGLTPEMAFNHADLMIAAVQSINSLLPDHLRVGASVGIATFPADAQDYQTLVRLADQAMYLAKREGGNRVRTSDDLRLLWEDVPRAA